MANFNIAPQAHLPKFNGIDTYEIVVTLPATATNADTITVTLPLGMPKDVVPVRAIGYSNATPALPISVTITSHNRTTGVSVLTLGTGAAAGQKVYVQYVNA